MILQALKQYYDRKVADPEAGMAPMGWEPKEIPFMLILDPSGKPVSLNDTREGTGRDRRARKHLVPQAVIRTSGKIAANLLWDNPAYMFGITAEGANERTAQLHAAFCGRVESLDAADDPGLSAVKAFLRRDDKAALLSEFGEPWKDLLETGANATFQLVGETKPVLSGALFKRAYDAELAAAPNGAKCLCLVSGEQDVIARLHAPIKGVRDAQSSGARIVAFNCEAFNSLGKEQGANAPIGQAAAFAYTTALNHLLGRDSRQKLQVGDATTVFWSEKPSLLEAQFSDFFGEPPKDDPDRGTRAVESLLRAPQTGVLVPGEAGTRFYVLGLAPNASRIAVRFWVAATIADMCANIRQHFLDLAITHGPRDMDALSIFRMLTSIAPLGKAENIPPNIAGATMRCILAGLPYPKTLLDAAIRRNRAEQTVTYARAALLKACINRMVRFQSPHHKEELAVSLDTSNDNAGYRLGRLFATLEKIQMEASPGINATIRDRYYGAASGVPVTVFGNLMRLKNHHLAKLDSAGRRVNFEKLLAEIMGGVADFPAHLSMVDQGRFAIGYYHQMQDFFTRKKEA